MTQDLFDLPLGTRAELGELSQLAARLRLDFLDAPGATFTPPDWMQPVMRQLQWRTIAGSARRGAVVARGLPSAFWVAVHSAGTRVGYRVDFAGIAVRVAVGFEVDEAAADYQLLASLVGAPDQAGPMEPPTLGGPHHGCIVGIPGTWDTIEETAGEDVPSWPDVVLEVLGSARASLTFLATAEDPAIVDQRLESLRQIAKSIDRLHVRAEHVAGGDRSVTGVLDLIDRHIQRLERARSEGMWRASLVVSASTRPNVQRVLATLAGLCRPPLQNVLAPLRGRHCAPAGSFRAHSNVLTSQEMERMWSLPQRDRRGFAITRDVRFDVDVTTTEDGIRLGEVLDGTTRSGQVFAVESHVLCRHVLIAGHTGSGKSTTIRALLRGLDRARTPFLVIDPVKPISSEYRDLLAAREDVLSYRLGVLPGPDETLFQFNPLAFPTGFSLFTHIDYLKAAITAAFGLVPPAPYLLESAIIGVYARKGWDMSTGAHRDPRRQGDLLSFPRLTDLLEEIDHVVDAAHYSDQLSRDLKAALRTRIGNLCVGPKGMALDTHEQIADAILFDAPVIVELKSIGTLEEQALVMGLILTRLFEYRQVQGIEPQERLRHVLVIEEAHRLLKEAPAREVESANAAHQAVELFASLISEVRAYGQSFVIAEQLPSVLASRVVKQTSTKIIHRLTPRDDRELVGDAMGLGVEQKSALLSLGTGDAVAFTEGMDGAIRITVDGPPTRTRAPSSPLERLRRRSPRDAERAAHASERCRWAGQTADATVRRAADRVLAKAAAGGELAPALLQLDATVQGRPQALADAALGEALFRRARAYDWTYEEWMAEREQLRRRPREYLAAFSQRSARAQAPHPWCRSCPAPCRYRYEGTFLARDPTLRAAVESATSKVDRIALLREALTRAQRGVSDRGSWSDVPAFCALGHISMAGGDTLDETEQLLSELMTGRHT